MFLPPGQIYFWPMMISEKIPEGLVHKYNRPIPRYTSYPAVPFWKEKIDGTAWKSAFQQRFSEENHVNGISLYVHLPFCESLCTYCGCNKKITTNHKVEEQYIAALEKEWQQYRKLMKQTPVLRELHLGGGTPTFFSPTNLKALLGFLLHNSIVHPQRQFSFEGHPNNTTEEHLQILYELGFRRLSLGVQDNDPRVQKVINRIQPFENVKKVTTYARSAGYTSVNFDLIYGLPLQTLESIGRTINEVLSLRPDRIAFYSYAHVPWTSKAQRLFNEDDLPGPEDKIALYLKGKKMLLEAGYREIGFDHFALPTDELWQARKEGRLHRNFMGYTTHATGLLVGLGVSSISDLGIAFGQNEKKLDDYYAAIGKDELPVKKGFFLSPLDQRFRNYILDISCKNGTTFFPADLSVLKQFTFPQLEALARDGLVEWTEKFVRITSVGHHFIRNICAAFDLYLNETPEKKNSFSKAV